ncbi:MAG: type II secretion system minor pseudopilin GspH [Candidatus Thiodiazotropha sp.]
MTPSGVSPKAATAGFTLIEVMVVVVIIGILINFAVLSLRSHSPGDQLNEEAQRLRSLLQIASEEALLRSSFIGVDITETGYGFLRLEEETWQPVDDTLFRNRELPDEVQISINMAQPPGDDDDEEKRTPEIILLNSGEITPFDLKISSIHSDDYFRLSGNETGELSLERISP